MAEAWQCARQSLAYCDKQVGGSSPASSFGCKGIFTSMSPKRRQNKDPRRPQSVIHFQLVCATMGWSISPGRLCLFKKHQHASTFQKWQSKGISIYTHTNYGRHFVWPQRSPVYNQPLQPLRPPWSANSTLRLGLNPYSNQILHFKIFADTRALPLGHELAPIKYICELRTGPTMQK